MFKSNKGSQKEHHPNGWCSFWLSLAHLRQRSTGQLLVANQLSVAKEVGSEGSAAGGGGSDLSEWQRSARSKLVVTSAASAGHRNSKTD